MVSPQTLSGIHMYNLLKKMLEKWLAPFTALGSQIRNGVLLTYLSCSYPIFTFQPWQNLKICGFVRGNLYSNQQPQIFSHSESLLLLYHTPIVNVLMSSILDPGPTLPH